MRKIATINEDGFCYTVGEFEDTHLLRENQMDVTGMPDVLGKVYQDGAWITREAESEPTEQEMLAEVLLSTEYLACLMEENLESV